MLISNMQSSDIPTVFKSLLHMEKKRFKWDFWLLTTEMSIHFLVIYILIFLSFFLLFFRLNKRLFLQIHIKYTYKNTYILNIFLDLSIFVDLKNLFLCLLHTS